MKSSPSSERSPVAALIERHLRCPKSHRPLTVSEGVITARGSPFAGRVERDVAVMLENVPVSYFDDKFAVMQSGHEERGGEWHFAYAQQIALLEERLARGGLVLDVGCGPALPYRRSADAFVIGLEYSLPSIAANAQVDLRVCASAAELPLADASIDTIVCLYSIHHMIGSRVTESEALVEQVLREFARVLKPDGVCLVFEMSPVGPFGLIERSIWGAAKRLLGPRLDMYFWPAADFRACAARNGWAEGEVRTESFASSPWTTFPPIFSLTWLRIPRFLYPLKPVLHRLHLASGGTRGAPDPVLRWTRD